MGNFGAHAAYRLVLPVACLWAWRQEARIGRLGTPLTPQSLADAREIGVRQPERVRLRAVDEVPEMSPLLRSIARRFDLCAPGTLGMSLRYGIYVRTGHGDDRGLVAHELVHTAQYERLGGIWPFMRLYLFERLIAPGYPFGPLEQEAVEVGKRVGRG